MVISPISLFDAGDVDPRRSASSATGVRGAFFPADSAAFRTRRCGSRISAPISGTI